MKLRERIKRSPIADIPEFVRPAFTDSLRFPDDITKLAAANVAELMGKYAALQAFVEQEATSWLIREMSLEQELDDARSAVLQDNHKLHFMEKWKMAQRVDADPSVRKIRQRLTLVRSLKERAQSLVRSYERLGQVLSRELSRRLATNDGFRGRLNGA